MKKLSYEEKVKLLIPFAVAIADEKIRYMKGITEENYNDKWDRLFFRAMNDLTSKLGIRKLGPYDLHTGDGRKI